MKIYPKSELLQNRKCLTHHVSAQKLEFRNTRPVLQLVREVGRVELFRVHSRGQTTPPPWAALL